MSKANTLAESLQISDARGNIRDQISLLQKAIRVALTGSASVRGLQALDDADLDMGTNDFTVFVQKRITTTRPAANEILYHKHDGVNGVIVTLLTTGVLRLTINGLTYDSTAALPSATNVEPVIMIPTVRETVTAAGSVTFVVDGVQLGSAVTITAHGSLTSERISDGDFVASPGAWVNASVGTGNAVIGGGSAVITGTDSPNRGAMQQNLIGIVAGDVVEVVLTGTVASGTWRMGVTAIDTAPNAVVATGVSTARFVATGATPRLYVWHVAGAGANATFTACSVKKVASVDNTSNLFLLGTSTTTTEGDYLDGGLYNRALTVAECLAYCVRGPDFSDVGASQTAVYAGNYSAGVDGVTTTTGTTLTGNIDGIDGENDWLRIERTGATGNNFCLLPVSGLVGKRVRTSVKIHNAAGSGVSYFYISYVSSPPSATQQVVVAIAEGTTKTIALDAILSRATTIAIAPSNVSGGNVNVATGSIYYVKESLIYKSGLVGHWPAFNAQTNTGQLADRSGNKNHMLLPASGATILGDRRPEIQILWENTWASTSELQYVPGVNQAVYPANFYIEGILLTPSATTTAGFIIGNGSDTDYYATVSGPLTAGVPVFVPLTNRYPDGTNLKLTITPMATTTCTLATTVFGRLLGGF